MRTGRIMFKMKSEAVTRFIQYAIMSIWLISKQVRCCAPDFLPHGDMCYRLVSVPSRYTEAESECNDQDSRLASITDSGTLHFLISNYGNHYGNVLDKEGAWVGLKSFDGYFEWSNGVMYDSLQSWVLLFEANISNPNYKCFALKGSFPQIVSGYRCSEFMNYICEAPFNATHQCYADVPPAFISTIHISFISKRCIYSADVDVPIDEALGYCVDTKGDLMDISDILEENIEYLVPNTIQTDKMYWTKLRWNGTHLLLPSAAVLDIKELPDIAWVPAERGACVVAIYNYTTAAFHVTLLQRLCSDWAHVICGSAGVVQASSPDSTPTATRDESLSCPQGFNWKEDKASGFCFWETSYETNRQSWEDARRYCQSYGGDLASFHSIAEEKIGLNFQYGSLSHPFWIGLHLDRDSGNYTWSDGSSLNYENWAPGQPDHKNGRRGCVSMDASAKHWVSSLCGILSWFVCKAPKARNPKVPVLPTQEPLRQCFDESSHYFESYCYEYVAEIQSWHRSEQKCQNRGGSLVSIHNAKEMGFLLKVFYKYRKSSTRVWIGLNSLGYDGAFRWTDHSVLDFTDWNEDEPNNFQNQEKCCNMDSSNGLWGDENCNAKLVSVCKIPYNASNTPVTVTTPPTRSGNCKKGWFEFQERCYLPVGETESQMANWSTATSICDGFGGYLTSVRNDKDQAFLILLMQRLKNDTWIGLHDTIESKIHYWTDNSDLQYTNWNPGEPSSYGYEEDCVLMVYGTTNNGRWKDELCSRNLPFICQNEKDPKLEPSNNRGMNCLHPEDWMQLDNSCFKTFIQSPASTWSEAKATCRNHGAQLISVADPVVVNVAKHLAYSAELESSFWIGLQVNPMKEIYWMNGLPVIFTKWDVNEPDDLSEDMCFASSVEGHWRIMSCSERLPFMCQITSGSRPPRKRITGNCPSKSDSWVAGEGSYCYMFDSHHRLDWDFANFQCYKYGGSFASIHSLKEIEWIKENLKPEIKSFYIGLTQNEKGGFAWTDDSPVDFTYWDTGEVQNVTNSQCVIAAANTLKWKLSFCSVKRPFLCAALKDTVIFEDVQPESALQTGDFENNFSLPLTIGIFVILIAVAAIAGAIFIYNRPMIAIRFRLMRRQNSLSFENALYNADTASMEFDNEKNHTCVT